jgi:phospholipase C
VPFTNRYDPSLGFLQAAASGSLPAVTFVEPNFTDLPPPSSANDDLAPTNLLRGQEVIHRVVEAVRSSPKWGRTLLLITYDEHGGFYDHVPPPGTDKGPPEWKGKVTPLGPPLDYMGPRVPAILVSPKVAVGGVCKQVFDHTSIIKTILLRHREKFPSHVFTQFGPRVNIAADLGLALTRSTRSIERPTPILRPDRPARRRAAPALPHVNPKIDPDGFHKSLHQAFLPRRPARR